MRIQPLLMDLLTNDANVMTAAEGGVWSRPVAAPRFDDDPLATPEALELGTPMVCAWVNDPGMVPHPTASGQGYVDFWPEVSLLYPVGSESAANTLREAVYGAIAHKRVETTWGQVARLSWVEEPSPPIPHQTFPDTMVALIRYRATTRRGDETDDAYYE